MTYSIIGMLASVVLLITNRDVFWSNNAKDPSETQRRYRSFLLAVLAYYITDMLWGFLDEYHLTALQFADTTVYFVAMAAAVLLWTRYVIAYLEDESIFATILLGAVCIFFVAEIVVVAANIFTPILFWFDETGAYHAAPARYATLGSQILMFLFTSIYTLSIAWKTEGSTRLHHLTIGLFGIAMMALIGMQIAFPLLPFYAMGYMLGTCVMHSFVVEDEKEEYRRELERAIARERTQKRELAESREALKDAFAAAESANKAKTAFLSNMSHEIRTPMNAIIGLDSIALADPNISDATRGHLQKIDSSAHHLLNIINEILDMSRIESGRMVIRNEQFCLSKTLEQINVIISGQCNEKGLRYECRTPGTIDEYYIGDDMKLRQVMINILGNAVKFTPEGGTVTFTIENTARRDGMATLRFTIEDTGIGMSEEFLPHLFEAFSQEETGNTSKFGSTGLGMPITKSIVELMNGKIDVKSQKGVGTTFTVTLTFTEVEQRQGGEIEMDLQPNKMSVLVVDDDRIACEHAEIVLRQVGITCETVLSGREAVEMAKLHHARQEDYSLVLVDWKMPEMDGVQTARKIREVVDEGMPIIILTSYNWEDVADEAKAAGVDAFVSKPLFAGTVMEEFREAFRKKNGKLVRETADLAGRRVLLAEDVAVNAEIIMMVLSMREMEVEHAENGRVAVDMFADTEPGYYDAVLMDMRMPEMDGLEATATIRSMDRPDAQEIPIIALTANAFDEDVQQSMQAGLDAHLSKPVEPDLLLKTLESFICTRS